MKAVLGFFGLLAVLGIVYALALFGVIPTQKLAAKSPAIAQALTALHLAKPIKKSLVATAPAPASPQQKMLDAEKQQLDAQRAQLDKDKTTFEAQQQQALAAPTSSNTPSGPDMGAKLTAIYATMDPDDLAKVFAKMPDPVVIQAVMQMDEKEGGAIFAALPPDRAARLSQIMAAHSPPHPATTVAAAPAGPASSL
jgi:flagellar motility protein MotE (MotC chaperone)